MTFRSRGDKVFGDTGDLTRHVLGLLRALHWRADVVDNRSTKLSPLTEAAYEQAERMRRGEPEQNAAS